MNNPEPGYDGMKYPVKSNKKHRHEINLVSKSKSGRYRGKAYIIGISAALVFLVSFLLLAYYTYSEKDNVLKNTYVKYNAFVNYDIGNMNYKAAENNLNEDMESCTDTSISIVYGSETVEAKPKDLGVKFDYSNSLNEIKNSIYGPNIFDSIRKHFSGSKTIEVIPDISLDSAALDSFIKNHFGTIDADPQNAGMYVQNNKVVIKKETAGKKLDRQKLSDIIISAVKNNINSLDLPVSPVLPATTEKDLQDQIPAKAISSYKTSFVTSPSGRKANVRLGASLLNNIILKPGEEFEYWKYVGNPTAQRGFQSAPVYLNGKVTTGIGGGLCQVSTTLYNAALLADLEITRRQPHGMPVHYVPLGLDATVDYNSLTLKFVNNTGKYLLIKSSTDNDVLKFSILGFMPAGKTVRVYAKSAGYNQADAYREVYMNGSLVRKDYLGRSKYRNPQ